MNKDGKITKDELMRVNMMNAWARRDMDLNKDGLLDRNEIETFTLKILGEGYDTEVGGCASIASPHKETRLRV